MTKFNSRAAAVVMTILAAVLIFAVPMGSDALGDQCCGTGVPECTAASLCYSDGWCAGNQHCNVKGPGSCSWVSGC